MKRLFLLLCLLAGVAAESLAQPAPDLGALLADYRAARTDSQKLMALQQLTFACADAGHPDALRYSMEALQIGDRLSGTAYQSKALMVRGYALCNSGDPAGGLKAYEQGMQIARRLGRAAQLMDFGNMAGTACMMLNEPGRAVPYFQEAIAQIPAAAIPDSAAMRQELMGRLTDAYMMSGQQEKAFGYLEERLRVARATGRRDEETWATGQLGAYYKEHGDFGKAFRYYNESWKLAQELGLKEAENEATLSLANIYNQFGDFPKSVEFHNRVIRTMERSGDREPLAAALANLAQVYQAHTQYDEALKLYERALDIARALNKQLFVAAILHNIGDVRFRKGHARAGDSLARAALAINEQMGTQYFITKNYNLLGEIAQQARSWDKARHYYEMCGALARKEGLQDDITSSERLLGLLAIAQAADSSLPAPARAALGREAISHLRSAEAGALAIGATTTMEEIYTGLSDAYKLTGDYKTSMEYFKKAAANRDSLFSQQAAFKIARLESEAALAQKDAQLSGEAAEAARLRRRQSYIVGIGGALLLLAAAGFLIYRAQRRRREKLAKAEFEKRVAEVEMQALRAQMNPHFIFNALSSINHHIAQNDPVTATNHLTKFAKLIRLILDSSASRSVSLAQETELLRLYLQMESMRFGEGIDWKIDVDERLDREGTRLPSMIIQPYVENAIWHGLLHRREGGKLRIRFEPQRADLKVIVEDDGVGRERAAEMRSKVSLKEKSHGMRITAERLRMSNLAQNTGSSVQIEDLKHIDGGAAGTRVTLIIQTPAGI